MYIMLVRSLILCLFLAPQALSAVRCEDGVYDALSRHAWGGNLLKDYQALENLTSTIGIEVEGVVLRSVSKAYIAEVVRQTITENLSSLQPTVKSPHKVT